MVSAIEPVITAIEAARYIGCCRDVLRWSSFTWPATFINRLLAMRIIFGGLNSKTIRSLMKLP
jgi:hypothetical protein